jgi:hypothetical protein
VASPIELKLVDVLSTSISSKTKKVLAQTGSNNGPGQTCADNVAWMQQVGICSRPANPEKGKQSARALVLCSGGHDAAIASEDERGLTIYGNLGPGETCLYAVGEDGTAQARILLKGDGSINIFTKEDNDSSGAGMGIFVNADGSINIASHNGAAVMLTSDGDVRVFNASGGIQVKADGSIKLASGAKVEISGASITMGGPTALPVAIGPNVVTAVTALQTQIMALQVECAAIAGALVACMNIPGPILPPHGTAAAVATAAVGVAAGILAGSAAGVTTASAIIPALRTSAD